MFCPPKCKASASVNSKKDCQDCLSPHPAKNYELHGRQTFDQQESFPSFVNSDARANFHRQILLTNIISTSMTLKLSELIV